MKVITLNRGMLADNARRLQNLVGEYNPDLIVGIARGGVFVADLMFVGVEHVSVAASRPSTSGVKQKSRLLNKILRGLPRWMLDFMRIAESRFLSLKKVCDEPVVIDDEVRQRLSVARRVLVVDDAVDSGGTLRRALEAVERCAVAAEVRSAVITVTTDSPVARPDYVIFDEGILIRFPWSNDYNEEDDDDR